MTAISKIYEMAIKKGLEHERRSPEEIKKHMENMFAQYSKIPEHLKIFFDKDRFYNPYDDTRILCGSRDKDVSDVFVAIDADVSTMLMINEMRKLGHVIDLLIVHHPVGIAKFNLDKIVQINKDIWDDYGVGDESSSDIVDSHSLKIKMNNMAGNWEKVVGAAKMLDIPMMTIHTPADNCISKKIQKMVNKHAGMQFKDFVHMLYGHPEFLMVMKNGFSAAVGVGNSQNFELGKTFVAMTGGTESDINKIIPELKDKEVSTIVMMHASEDVVNECKKNSMNLIVCNHMAACSMGMNLLLDEVIPGANITPISGMIRPKQIVRTDMAPFIAKDEIEE